MTIIVFATCLLQVYAFSFVVSSRLRLSAPPRRCSCAPSDRAPIVETKDRSDHDYDDEHEHEHDNISETI